MARLNCTIACNLDADILSASYPLLAEGKVDAMEWSFDALYERNSLPGWFEQLLQTYSSEKKLVAHGVFFSLFSGKWTEGQRLWLDHLRTTAQKFPFDHVTEHFGFMTGRDFHHGAPLNIPYNKTTLAIGRDRLARIQDASQAPVGLENLAFSYSLDDVKRHGDFLEKLVEPVNGFIILDLHNLYCQLHNFSLELKELLALYPMERIREIHISGGSWESHEQAPGKKVRRDTHDNGVPAEVFELLHQLIPLCPNLKYIVLEQLGTALKTSNERKQFYSDFVKMKEVVAIYEGKLSPVNQFQSSAPYYSVPPIEDKTLYQQQLELSDILENSETYEDARQALLLSSLAGTDWMVEQWRPYMLDTAISIAKKWKKQSD